ncbi:MAG: hypothetical protein Q9168_006837 [Polycauliona sp. 1 TL-2023]
MSLESVGRGDGTMQSTTSNPMYALRDVPGKGKGLVATCTIPKGTRILSEEPIIAVARNPPTNKQSQASICQQVEALDQHQRQAFLSMYNIHPYKDFAEQCHGIIRTNGLPHGVEEDEAGIFLEACRINHACDNNAQNSWNANIKRHTVHALRDIVEGEEITIYYIGIHGNRKARIEALHRKFSFTCSCRLCSLPSAQSQESDKRLEEIYRLDGLVYRDGTMGVMREPQRILQYVDRIVRLYNEQGPDDAGLPRAFLDAAQVVIAHSDLARGRIFAERAVSGWKTSSGSDCMELIQHGHLAHDPSKLGLYGMSMKWKTTVNDIPRGLEPSDSEDWLWRREKPKPKPKSMAKPKPKAKPNPTAEQPGHLADLRNQSICPGFKDLPNDRDPDPKFFDSSDGITNRPRRHWCFFGEITEFLMFARLQMSIKDVNGRDSPLFFYTDGRGREVAPALIQKGYTVAVLYATQHAFIYDKPGIRHEDPSMIKVENHEIIHLYDKT